MGLDQFLKLKLRVPIEDIEKTIGTDIFTKILPINFSILYKSVSIDVTVAYWRKANQIHRWFLKLAEDDQQHTIDIKTTDLRCLYTDILHVLRNKEDAPNILPVMHGFFFGSYNYDDYYFALLDEAKRSLEGVFLIIDALREKKIAFDVYYYASW